jgi:hypothetical protein
MDNNYLIPANSKRGLLYFSAFTLNDLILFGVGVAVSFILLYILPVDKMLFAILAAAPGCICGFLVIPVPNYHNIRTVIKLAYEFYTTRQKFVWKGWCVRDGEDSKK